MKAIARKKTFRGAVAGVAAVVACCFVSSVAAGCGRLTMDFDEMWSAAGDPGSARVNPETYERVEEGMTYDEVAAIFGGPGYFTMEYTLAGHTDKGYDWIGRDDYNVSAYFRGGVLVRKSWWITGQEDSERSDAQK